MEKGDIITLVVGVILVLIMAVVANPQVQLFPGQPAPVPTPGETPVPTPVETPVISSTPLPTSTPTPVPTIAPPYQIYYSSDPFTYPRFKMPENMNTFGAGDLLRRDEMVTFAFMNGTRGGLSQKFRVPYPVWVLNTTVTADRNPQYGNFRMVLCYAANGTIIDGEEILNRGSMTRVVETSGAEVYMIITTAYVDYFRIELATPRDYYDAYTPA
ncbi:MAG: hypothetical protein M0R30_02015 [Methanoregula sp.]|uniref:hypothetical protein n=1 Tax=Methanoregula sp. TaxID=2052170 RepID=UPI0025D53F09|nr:hypothetical protein [Methanoregula sp.]MCK9630391.1 hypothetical protein [Methanoregula sp.]